MVWVKDIVGGNVVGESRVGGGGWGGGGGGVFFFFFFQAEDGIRDTSVTGVQTCALPISLCFLNARRIGVPQTPRVDASPALQWLCQSVAAQIRMRVSADSRPRWRFPIRTDRKSVV